MLLKAGLQAIEQGAQSQYDTSFLNLDIDQQKQYLQHISESAAKPNEIWNEIPQEALFKKLLNLTVESYCSHPRVWSEIGYAGPAYPRGYIRTQLGQLDPWEAQPKR
ncbi:gluconate 2-dehydrogenase subunit 3 family protein [Paenibacillus sp. NPDC056579]|uniref:gluconate 2-dehydrogenase subunit 3 family protein n=1 Tax=Paenibacillus sp. NPDC056579 TaxID=3345871 RepID=UPI0036A06379